MHCDGGVRHARRTDGNQGSLVAYLRTLGCSVEVLSDVGRGVPDLLVGLCGVNALAEVKDPAQPLSARRLTPDQAEWHRAWRGQVTVLETEDDALALVARLRRDATEPVSLAEEIVRQAVLRRGRL